MSQASVDRSHSLPRSVLRALLVVAGAGALLVLAPHAAGATDADTLDEPVVVVEEASVPVGEATAETVEGDGSGEILGSVEDAGGTVEGTLAEQPAASTEPQADVTPADSTAPADGGAQPADASPQPTEESLQPADGSAQQTDAGAQPTEGSAQQTEAGAEAPVETPPSVEEAAPAVEVVELVEPTAEPAATDPSAVAVMAPAAAVVDAVLLVPLQALGELLGAEVVGPLLGPFLITGADPVPAYAVATVPIASAAGTGPWGPEAAGRSALPQSVTPFRDAAPLHPVLPSAPDGAPVGQSSSTSGGGSRDAGGAGPHLYPAFLAAAIALAIGLGRWLRAQAQAYVPFRLIASIEQPG